jgi:hypothetical protein
MKMRGGGFFKSAAPHFFANDFSDFEPKIPGAMFNIENFPIRAMWSSGNIHGRA